VKNDSTGYDGIRASIKEAKGFKDKPNLIKVTQTGNNIYLLVYLSFWCSFIR
jgi:hypothetical protein